MRKMAKPRFHTSGGSKTKKAPNIGSIWACAAVALRVKPLWSHMYVGGTSTVVLVCNGTLVTPVTKPEKNL